jgi:hypothetical protein
VAQLGLGCSDESGVESDSRSNGEQDIRTELETALDGLDFFFGNLHSHTSYSDGEGTAEEAFSWARYGASFDFYVVTDHAEFLSAAEWLDIAEQADAFNEEGAFVALRGFEWSHPIFGHVNVYGSEDFTNAIFDFLLGSFYEWVDQNGALAQFNHPGREKNLFRNMEFEERVADNFFAVETGNKGDGNYGSSYLPYYPRFLDQGWKVAPTSNQDNHSLQTNSHRTVCIGESLTREALLEAMHSRRLYSSDDPDTRVVFKLGENWMGSEVETRERTVEFTAIVEDDEPIAYLELITSGGAVLNSKAFAEETRIVSWHPTVEVFGDAYYYLQVTSVNDWEEDGPDPEQIAVTSPIWVTVTE